jgi:uncharacterized protein YhjY with autotransporter beta-barrel domain
VTFTGDGTERFLTRLLAPGKRPPGFELDFGQAFGDPAVQSAITAARKALTDAGVPKSIAHQGPVRISSSLTSSGSPSGPGVVTGSQTTLSVQTELAIGPTTIIIGDRDTGGVPFVVIAGSSNFNTNTNTDTLTSLTQNRGGSLLSETYVFPIDFGAVISLIQSGLPVALLQREVLLSLENVATRDLNGHLFRLRAGAGAADGAPGPTGQESKTVELAPPGWEVFATGDFGIADQEQSGTQAGFGSETWAGTIGLERRVAPGFTLGLAGTYLENRTDLSQGLGRLDIEGFAVAAYASYVRSAFYADLLYSFGDYENEVRRNTLAGSTARATPHAQHHTVQFRTGWNFHAGPVETGPIAGASYTHGALDSYTETGAGNENTRVAGQDYDSLTSELGWHVSQRVPVSFGAVTWQLRASWQHQYLDESESVAVGLVESPLYSVSGGSLRRTGSLTLNGETAEPDRDSLTVGGGLLVEVGARTRVLLDYAGNFTGGDRSEQVVALRVGVSF